MEYLDTDFSIPKNQITYWFKTNGKTFGLRYEGKNQTESIIHRVGDTDQKQTCISSVFVDQIRAAKEAL